MLVEKYAVYAIHNFIVSRMIDIQVRAIDFRENVIAIDTFIVKLNQLFKRPVQLPGIDIGSCFNLPLGNKLVFPI